MTNCRQEMCPNWSGDGRVCPCAIFDIDPPEPADSLLPYFGPEDEDGAA